MIENWNLCPLNNNNLLLSRGSVPCSDLATDYLLVHVVPEHLELRHRLLDGRAIGLLRHLLQQEAGLVVQTLHLNLELVRFSFELLKDNNTCSNTPQQSTKALKATQTIQAVLEAKD